MCYLRHPPFENSLNNGECVCSRDSCLDSTTLRDKSRQTTYSPGAKNRVEQVARMGTKEAGIVNSLFRVAEHSWRTLRFL